jgi:hypothetical protein
MFFSFYRLLLVLFQGARGLPLPEGKRVIPILPLCIVDDLYSKDRLALQSHPVGALGLPLPEGKRVIPILPLCIVDDLYSKDRLALQSHPVGVVVIELMPIYDDTDINNSVADE